MMDLDPVEVRILGCLIEKQRTTPDQYPLSLNSLRLACNQTTNRDPVVEYDEPMIREALHRLSQRRYTRLASGHTSRAYKFRHLLDEALGLDDGELAVLAVLLLRGAQTPGELKQRTERMQGFPDLAAVQDVLDALIGREYAIRLARRPGQKEERYVHLLSAESADAPPVETAPEPLVAAPPRPPAAARADRGARGRGRVAARGARRAARAGGRAAHRARRLTVSARTARVDTRRSRPSVRCCSKVFEAVREARVKRFGVGLAVLMAIGLALAVPAQGAYKAPHAVKIDVMGEWAHPDDDTSIIGPCGVWHERYGVRCGIIMVTRGEGGGNAVGTEIGPPLGLRRENEDRVAHYRSGTVDIFNLDRVDFFYNQSAPLTQYFWGERETLRRVTRIIRMTQPEVYIGFTPSLNAGHGNHQQAGRYIWEGVQAAADPSMFPEQLRGPHKLSTWQVKKVFSGGSSSRHRRDDDRAGLHHRLRPRRPTRARSPASGPATTRRSTGRPATSRASRRARRRSGRRSRSRAPAPTRPRAGRCSWATSRRAARASARPTRSSRSSPT